MTAIGALASPNARRGLRDGVRRRWRVYDIDSRWATKRRLAILCAIVAVMTPGTWGRCDAAERSPLSLTVTSSCRDASHCTLFLRLANRSSSPIELYESFLPWKWYGMLLLAAENRPAGAPLPVFQATDDPDPETITVKPGTSLTGQIDLFARFHWRV